ncbi:EAL domain-containing protein [Kineococcus rubinsiae]|uniref:EAL domain-containing protein n=1 Tax=Kineococcus rubinsiae TaxID=2609562 RepID=UPI00142FAEBA|nr:EAL domain-containing protein [Kineococcus rubinsiae]
MTSRANLPQGRPSRSAAGVVCSAVALAVAVTVAIALVWVVPTGGATLPVLVVVLVVVLVTTPAVLVHSLLEQGRRRSTQDPVLDVANRTGLAEECAGWLTSLAGYDTAATVSVVHFDDLRDLRLALGADSALELLAEAARRLSRLEGAVVARIDHDTLAVVRPVPLGYSDSLADAGLSLGERQGRAVQAALQQPVRLGARGLEVRPETSVGVACVPDHGTDLEELLAAADVALVTAAGAPSRVALAEGAAVLDVEALALHAQLPAAIAAGELRVHYQPLVAAGGGRLVGVEALVRWQHPERGLLGPGAFVPLAERSQAILGLTEWVLRTAVAQTAAWRAAGHDLGVSVNVAAPVLAEESFLATVQDVLDAHELPPSVLTLEVTESALLEDPHRAAELLSALRAAGARISIDDFGTGYTSLTMLRELDVDELKIDRTFVDAAPHTASDAAIVRALVDLGHRLSMEVVAEGVEDARTAGLMTRLGVDVLQGFHFSRPVPADELLTALQGPEPSALPSRSSALLPGEEQRLADVRHVVPLIQASKPFFDTLSALAATLCGVPTGAVTVVDEDLVRVLAGHGDPGPGGPREELPCSQAVLGRTVVEVPDLLLDPRWAGGAAARAGMRSYAGAPLVDPRGRVLGVLCVSSPEPGPLLPHQLDLLAALAGLAVEHLQAAEASSVLPRLQSLLQVLPELDRVERHGELLEALADATIDLLGADVLLVTGPTDPDGGAWGLLTQRGLPVDASAFTVHAGDLSGVARAIRTQRPVWVPDTLTSAVLDQAHVERLNAASVLVVPVVTATGAEWVVSAVWQTPRPDLPAALRDGAVALASRTARQLDRASFAAGTLAV